MEEFYIDVELRRGLTRIQVDEVSPEEWDMPYIPQFVIEFHTGQTFLTLTVHLENGAWYDRNTRLSDGDFHLRYFELGPDAWNPGYQSPLSAEELKAIGIGISNYMIVRLTAYMSFFVSSFRNHTLN
jgi:hypothetical protein